MKVQRSSRGRRTGENAMMHHQTIKDKQLLLLLLLRLLLLPATQSRGCCWDQRRWRPRLEKLGGGLAVGWTWRRGFDFQNFHGCVVMRRRGDQRWITISEEEEEMGGGVEMKRGWRPWRKSSVHPWCFQRLQVSPSVAAAAAAAG